MPKLVDVNFTEVFLIHIPSPHTTSNIYSHLHTHWGNKIDFASIYHSKGWLERKKDGFLLMLLSFCIISIQVLLTAFKLQQKMFRKRRKSLGSCWNWLEFLLWTICLLNTSYLAQIFSSLVHQEFSCCINFLHHLDYYCKFNESFHWCIGKLSGQWDLREQKESCFCPTIGWSKNVTFSFP